LSAADTVIIFDSDSNPQNDILAQARFCRMGQKQVKVYRLITRNTCESTMFQRRSSSKANEALTNTDMVPLLKYGANELFRDDNESSQRFFQEDIDQILATRIAKTSLGEDKLSKPFSKASFPRSSAESELDINDTDFWKKLLPVTSPICDPVATQEKEPSQ